MPTNAVNFTTSLNHTHIAEVVVVVLDRLNRQIQQLQSELG